MHGCGGGGITCPSGCKMKEECRDGRRWYTTEGDDCKDWQTERADAFTCDEMSNWKGDSDTPEATVECYNKQECCLSSGGTLVTAGKDKEACDSWLSPECEKALSDATIVPTVNTLVAMAIPNKNKVVV